MLVSCDLILSGSYPHAQQYECYVTSNELIGKIQGLKKKRVNLEVWIKNDSDSIVKMDSYNERFEYLNFKIPITKDSSIIMYSVIFRVSKASIKSENRKNVVIELWIKFLGGKLRNDEKSRYVTKRHFTATVQLPIRNLFCDGGKEGKDEEMVAR